MIRTQEREDAIRKAEKLSESFDLKFEEVNAKELKLNSIKQNYNNLTNELRKSNKFENVALIQKQTIALNNAALKIHDLQQIILAKDNYISRLKAVLEFLRMRFKKQAKRITNAMGIGVGK